MVSNEYFIKNIELGGGHFLSHKNKTIKLKGDKAIVEFKETVSPLMILIRNEIKINLCLTGLKRILNDL